MTMKAMKSMKMKISSMPFLLFMVKSAFP